METKELKIQIPEGYEIDKEHSTFEKIVFKKKENTKPRSWEEYCNNFKGRIYYIQDDDISNISTTFSTLGLNYRYKNYIHSKELAEAFLAMMQLMSLRKAWVGDWEPDWTGYYCKYCIDCNDAGIVVETWTTCSHPLSFPTKETANDFMNCFKDLLEIAKPLV